MSDQVSKTERDAEIVRTCELAVSWLTTPGRGWNQGEYTEDEAVVRNEDGDVIGRDYTATSACLGGALVLSSMDELVTTNGPVFFSSRMKACPAVAAVAETIRSLPSADQGDAWYLSKVDRDDPNGSTIYAYNDTEGRKVEDVVDVLNRTIKRYTDESIGEAA